MSETTPNLPLTGTPTTTATKIVYTIASPYLSEIYLKKLSVLLNTGLGTNDVTGDIQKGTSTSAVSGSVFAGSTKFAALSAAASSASYVSVTYNDNGTSIASSINVTSS